MKPVVEIYLKNHCHSTTLNTRDEADAVFNFIKEMDSESIFLDFTDIEFVSRSFAHQFHKNKVEWMASNKTKFVTVNMSDTVYEMFHAVAKTYNLSLSEAKDISVIPFNDIRDLYRHLASI